MEDLQAGTILIADPFLKDPNFLRSTVFLCNYTSEGSIGFVLNRKTEFLVCDLFPELVECKFPVFYGGPVQKDSIHFLHRCPGLITGGEKIIDNIFWGGEFEELVFLMQNKKIGANDVRLFLGYSGWAQDQLDEEIAAKSWLTTYATSDLIFATEEKSIWANALKQLGSKYEQLIHYPTDPQLN